MWPILFFNSVPKTCYFCIAAEDCLLWHETICTINRNKCNLSRFLFNFGAVRAIVGLDNKHFKKEKKIHMDSREMNINDEIIQYHINQLLPKLSIQ